MLYLLLAPHGWEAPGFKPGRLPHDFPSRSSHGGFQGRCLQISAAGEARFQVASTNSLAEALDFESRGRASFRGWASRRLSRPLLSANHGVQFGPTASEPGQMRFQVACPGSRPLQEAPDFKSGGSEQISSLSLPWRLSEPLLLQGLQIGGATRISGPVGAAGVLGRCYPTAFKAACLRWRRGSRFPTWRLVCSFLSCRWPTAFKAAPFVWFRKPGSPVDRAPTFWAGAI